MVQRATALSAIQEKRQFEAGQANAFLTALQSNPRYRLVERLFFIGDLIALSLSFAIGGLCAAAIDQYIMGIPLESVSVEGMLEAFGAFLGTGLVALLWLDTKGHYNHRLPFWETNSHIFSIALVGVCIGGFAQFAAKSEYSRLWLGLSWVSFAVFLYAGRIVIRNCLKQMGKWNLPTLVIGEGAGMEATIRAFSSEPHMGYHILDVVSPSLLDDMATQGAWSRLLVQTGARHILLSIPDYKAAFYNASLQNLVYERIPYSIVPTCFPLPMSTLSAHYFLTQGVTIMHNTSRLELLLPRIIKRCFDILVSSMALLALSPVMAVLTLLLRRDGGTAFYGHDRIGHQGRSFKCLKFRSMVPNSTAILTEHLEADHVARLEWQKEQKLKNDPRVTRIGKLLRAYSIDELPQLINVLRGDMSLVGPRPIMPEESARYDNDIALYYRVRPGLTGLWQVSGRNNVSYETRVKMDRLYISNWSLWHDIAIILKTFPVIFKRTGAY